MLGDLVPRAVVEVADLLLVFHHVGWLASLLVLHGDVVLDGLEILAVLSRGTNGDQTRRRPRFNVKRRVPPRTS